MNRSAHHLMPMAGAPAIALLALLLAVAAPAVAQGRGNGNPHGGSGTPPPRGQGHLVPVLANGTLRSPSTDREEFTDDPYVLDAGDWDWDLALVGGSADQIGDLRSRSVEVMHADVRRGLGHGLEAGVQFEPWNSDHVEQGVLRVPVEENGVGPTTLRLRQRLAGEGEGHAGLAASAWLRIPGAPDGPGARVAEAGVALPWAVPLGKQTRVGGMIESDWLANALENGHDVDGVASLALTRQAGEHGSAWIEGVSVWSREAGRPWLGVIDAGFTWEPVSHVGLTLGASGGLGGGASDAGLFGRVGVHS
jgi:hypothetical protein